MAKMGDLPEPLTIYLVRHGEAGGEQRPGEVGPPLAKIGNFHPPEHCGASGGLLSLTTDEEGIADDSACRTTVAAAG